jgi:hypothetical protein
MHIIFQAAMLPTFNAHQFFGGTKMNNRRLRPLHFTSSVLHKSRAELKFVRVFLDAPSSRKGNLIEHLICISKTS